MATVQALNPAERETETLMLIDGERVRSLAGGTIEVFDPSTGKLIGLVPDGQQADIERAVAAASRAFRSPAWSGLSGQARARILWRMADLMEQHIEELADLTRWRGASSRASSGSTASWWATRRCSSAHTSSRGGAASAARKASISICNRGP